MAYQEVTRIFQHSKQKGAARLIMLAIAEHADTNGYAFPSAERIAAYAACSARHVERLIPELKDTPELYVLAGGGRWKSNRYVILAGCGPDEAIRRIQYAYHKSIGDIIGKEHAKTLIVNKWAEIMQNVDEMSEYPPQETPTSDTETPTSDAQNSDISSKETPTFEANTPTSDTDTPTSRPETPTRESDEPSIEPSENNRSLEPSKKFEPPERESQPDPKILSLIGYSDFQDKFFEITGRDPKLESHQSEVHPLAGELWSAGYRIEDLERTALLCSGWMTTPPHPKQVVEYIAAAKRTLLGKKKRQSQYGEEKGDYSAFGDTDDWQEAEATAGD